MTKPPFTILHEDNHIIVVVKPQGIPSQSDKSGDSDLLSQIKDHIKERDNKPGNVFVGLVHRLDRPTGGVMVFAKTSKAAARLSEQFASGDITKKYLAVVVGEPRDKSARLRHFLTKNSHTNISMAHIAKVTDSKEAVLDYKSLEFADRITLVDIRLITGRSHQARVQMQKIGCPIFGDTKYGGDTLAKGHNLALWAYELQFEHPVQKTTMVFKVFPPEEQVPWKYFVLDRWIDVSKPIDN
ncbi:MAG: RluA family pseudouridine synthase [Firmicutes bacterium]|nr:RluA family pseudouridine synthase [Bacillota bacterium]